MCRLIVVLQDKTFIYDLNSTRILEEIDTVHNPKGKHPTQNFQIAAHTIPDNYIAEAGGKSESIFELLLL
jgi:hypothetical protein